MTVASLGLALLLLPLPEILSPAPPEGPIDVVLAIDSSLSLQRSDPRGFGREIARDLVDFLLPGDRIGVVRFAGWEETMRRGAIVFPLSAIPTSDEVRPAFLNDYRSALDRGLVQFGRGTDFNVAFQEGIFRLFGGPEGMGTERPAWIILYTDGAMDVVEGERIRQRYVAESGGTGTPERDDLNRSALAILRKEVTPHLDGKGVTLSVLYPGDLRAEERTAPLPSRLPTRIGGSRETLVWILDQIGMSPASEYRDGAATAVAAGAPMIRAFRIAQGVSSARIFIFGESGDYDVDILGPQGTSLMEEGKAMLTRSGRLYRVYELSSPQAGDHLLTVETDSDIPARFLERFSFEHDLRLFVDIPADREAYHAGERVSLVAGLQDAKNGEPITDGDLLGGLKASLLVEDPNGNVERWAFPPASGGPAKLEIPLAPGAMPGPYRVRVIGRLLGPGGAEPGQSLAEAEASFSVRGVVSIDFGDVQSFSGREVLVRGMSESAGTPEGLEATVSHQGGKTSQSVALSWLEGRLEGAVTLVEEGVWTLKGNPTEWIDMVVGARSMLRVEPRRIRLFPVEPGAAGFPQKQLPKVLLLEKGGGHEGRVGIRFDILPGETGTLNGVIQTTDGRPVGNVSLDGGPQVTLRGGDRERIFQVRTTISPVEATLKFRATLGKYEDSREVQVGWQAAALAGGGDPEPHTGKAVLAAAAALALFVALLGIRWAAAPRFTDQRLWHIGDGEATEHRLADLRKGLRGNRAVGTPEVPLSMEFKLKSRKQAREGKCLLRPIQQMDQIYVNQFALAGPLELKDGAEIIVERDGFPVRYTYYAGEPRPDEIPMAQEVSSADETLVDEETTLVQGTTDTDRIPRPEDETQIE